MKIIFENFGIWDLQLRKRLFGSENVFKIKYLNVKRVESVEILNNIITQGNMQSVKINFLKWLNF